MSGENTIMCPFGYTHQPDACTHNKNIPTYLWVMGRGRNSTSTKPEHP